MRVHVYDYKPGNDTVSRLFSRSNLDINCNAELNIVEQQTFMNPMIRGKLNNLKLKGNEV